MLRINIDATPNTASITRRRSAAAAARRSSSSCTADEMLVGVHGRYGANYVNQVGPQCVQVDQFGRWIGDPVNAPVTGTTATGTAIRQDLPARLRDQRLPRPLGAVRRPDRPPVPGADAERRPHRHGHVPRQQRRHGRHGAGPASLRHRESRLCALRPLRRHGRQLRHAVPAGRDHADQHRTKRPSS